MYADMSLTKKVGKLDMVKFREWRLFTKITLSVKRKFLLRERGKSLKKTCGVAHTILVVSCKSKLHESRKHDNFVI